MRNADVDAARSFHRYPLYWVGTHFERWDLDYVDVGRGDADPTSVVGRSVGCGSVLDV